MPSLREIQERGSGAHSALANPPQHGSPVRCTRMSNGWSVCPSDDPEHARTGTELTRRSGDRVAPRSGARSQR